MWTECLDLIKLMLTVDITQRATLQHILQHPWVLGTQMGADSNANLPLDQAGANSSLPNTPQSSASVSSGSSLENNCVPVKVIECTVVSTNVPEEKNNT